MTITVQSSINEDPNFPTYPPVIQEVIKASLVGGQNYKEVYALLRLPESGYILLNVDNQILFYHIASQALFNDYKSCFRLTREMEKNTGYPTGSLLFQYLNNFAIPPATTGMTQIVIKESEVNYFIQFIFSSTAMVGNLRDKINYPERQLSHQLLMAAQQGQQVSLSAAASGQSYGFKAEDVKETPNLTKKKGA